MGEPAGSKVCAPRPGCYAGAFVPLGSAVGCLARRAAPARNDAHAAYVDDHVPSLRPSPRGDNAVGRLPDSLRMPALGAVLRPKPAMLRVLLVRLMIAGRSSRPARKLPSGSMNARSRILPGRSDAHSLEVEDRKRALGEGLDKLPPLGPARLGQRHLDRVHASPDCGRPRGSLRPPAFRFRVGR